MAREDALPVPVSLSWLTGPVRAVVHFSGPLLDGTLSVTEWFVRQTLKGWVISSVVASGSDVTITKGFGYDSGGSDVVWYNGILGQLKAADGTPLPAFSIS